MKAKMTVLSLHLSVIPLNINGLNSPIKTSRVAVRKIMPKNVQTIAQLHSSHMLAK